MLTTDRVREIYERHVRPLTDAERLQLVALLAEELAKDARQSDEEPLHDVMEFYGVGRGSRDDLDAQQYVNQLRGKQADCKE
jgi:hypothetical protein